MDDRHPAVERPEVSWTSNTGLGRRDAKLQLLAVGIWTDTHAARGFDMDPTKPRESALARDGLDAGVEDGERAVYRMTVWVSAGKELTMGLPSATAPGSEAGPSMASAC